MNANAVARFFVVVALFCVCTGRATAQAICRMDPWPLDDGCIRNFSIWPGDYLPPGTHCVCDGVPRVAAYCYIPFRPVLRT